MSHGMFELLRCPHIEELGLADADDGGVGGGLVETAEPGHLEDWRGKRRGWEVI